MRDEDRFVVPAVKPVARERREPVSETANTQAPSPVTAPAPSETPNKMAGTQTVTETIPAPAQTEKAATPAPVFPQSMVDGIHATAATVTAGSGERPTTAPQAATQIPPTAQAAPNANANATTTIAQLVNGSAAAGQAQTDKTAAASAQTAADTGSKNIVAAQAQAAGAQNTLAAQQGAAVQAGAQAAIQAGNQAPPQTGGATGSGSSTGTQSGSSGKGPARESNISGAARPSPAATVGADTAATASTATPSTQPAAAANTQTQSPANSQILAQAMASAAHTETAATGVPSPVSPAVTGDTLGITQSFNAEMRAAINAPTQAAAYTARGAVTPQPATEQIAMQISRAADQNVDRLSVQLKPAELGKVTIDLEIGPDNRLIAVISAERSETLDLLQRDARSLEKALNEAGVKTDSGSLEFNLQGDGGAAENGRDGDEKLYDGAIMLPGEPGATGADGIPAYTPLILPEGRIDIQV